MHVITPASDRSEAHEDANYRGTGMALCGVVEKNETLDDWLTKHRNFRVK
jgi:hypothetical protein